MDANEKKLIFALSCDSRISTKKLGKILRKTQQAASYSLNRISSKEGLLKYKAIIDPAMFGYVDIIVFYQHVKYDKDRIRKTREVLLANPYVTIVEDVAMGADFFVQYTVPTLSFFNQQNRDITEELKGTARVVERFAVVYKYQYQKNYLTTKPDLEVYVLSGDRKPKQLTELQRKVLFELQSSPRQPIARIANLLEVDPKTVMAAKRHLEDNGFISQYSVSLDYKKTGIDREHIFVDFDDTNQKTLLKLLEFCKRHKNVVRFTRLIGRYEFLLSVESINGHTVIRDLREEFPVTRYQIVKSLSVLKDTYFPSAVLNTQ